MAPGVFEGILRSEHEFIFPSRQVFVKKGVETPKNRVFWPFFEKLWNKQKSLLLEIDNKNLK